jgi:hypothetical protein
MPLRRIVPPMLVITVAVLLAMGEVQRLVGQVVSATGDTFPLGAVTGPGAITERSEWGHWIGIVDTSSPTALIHAYLVLDVAFILLYTLLTILVGRRFVADDDAARWRRVRLALILLVVTDVIEDALVWQAATSMTTGVPEPLRLAQAIASTVKFVFTIAVVVTTIRAPRVGRPLVRWLRRAGDALWAQRLSAIIVVIVAVLAVLPLNLILEQVPDMVRAWSDDVTGFVHMTIAWFALSCVGLVLFALGRKRAAFYRRIWVDDRTWLGNPPLTGDGEWDERRWPGKRYLLWFALPALALGFGVVRVLIDGGFSRVDGLPFTLFLLITGLVPIASLVIQRLWKDQRTPTAPAPPEGARRDEAIARADRAVFTGDILAVMIPVLGLLTLVRSFVPYLALYDEEFIGAAADALVPYWAATVVGLIAAAIVVTVPVEVLHRSALVEELPPAAAAPAGAPAAGPPEVSPATTSPVVAGIASDLGANLGSDSAGADLPARYKTVRVGALALIAVASVAIFALILLAPRWFGALVGGIGVMVAVIGAWAALVGLAIIVLRQRRPLGLFAALGFRSDPVILIFLVVPIVVAQLSGVTALHKVHESSVVTIDRPSMEQAFEDWLALPGCAGTSARPLVVVAAEGGGIRAATWTAAVFEQIAAADPCAAESIFLTSSVSGGSIGAAVAANSAPGEIVDNIEALNASAALPAAIAGLLVSDPIASTTGIRWPNAESGAGWQDRASLIEQSWRQAVPTLKLPFNERRHSPTGLIVLNSTDLLSSCRVSISQVILDGATPVDDATPDVADARPNDHDCTTGIDEPPLTIDLLNRAGLQADGSECATFDADWATAAMLSARFPVVTPAGGIHRSAGTCVADLQLVDGGYAENSGLGLIADISPRLAGIIRAHNDASDRVGPPVVPYLVYIQNSPDGYITEAPKASNPEIVVPVVGTGTKEQQLAASSWVQRIMSSFGAVCSEESACPSIPSASERTIIVAISTKPSVNLPLGWALSDASTTRIVGDAEAQASECPRVPGDYGCLKDLLDVLTPAP